MCGIFTYFGEIKEKELDYEANKICYRGPDMTRKVVLKDAYLCFHRLAIMGLNEEGMQPFYHQGKYVLCNGEIYGFRQIKKELNYPYKSDSDCEILLPLYEKYGAMMFNMLDAEFALVIYDENTKQMVAGRDPIGIRPLFYGTKNGKVVAFASEAKCLTNICDDVMPFPPGYYYEDGKFICYRDISHVELFHNDDIDTVTKILHDRLVLGVKKRLDSDAPLGFLLSGGLDSSLICSIASKCLDKPIKTFAVGMNTDAIDLKYAKEVSEYIKSEHTEIIITKEDVLEAIDHLIYLLETYDITTIRASIGMYLLCKGIKEKTDIRVLMTGEISDEIFGYKYTDFAPNALEFQREAEKRVHELYMYDVLRADRCISSCSMESRVPFGDLDFVSYAMSIDPEKKMNKYQKGKYLLRYAFKEGNYLPDNILFREKAAFSDAVGHSMVDYIKEYAESYYSDEQFAFLKEKYEINKPFTKESLFYREIFEKYYPNRAKMIKDFWMPNPNWENCKVDDPSARVLKNYGDSAK